MAVNFWEKMTGPMRGIWRDLKDDRLSILSSFRNTGNRFIRVMDEEIVMSDSHNVIQLFENIEKEAIQRGDTKLLVKNVDAFDKKMLRLVRKNEAAQYGALIHIRDQVKQLHKKKIDFMNKLGRVKRIHGIPLNMSKEIEEMVNVIFKEIGELIVGVLNEIKKQELMVSRERTQLRMFLVKFDANIKHDLAFFYWRMRDFDKQLEKDENLVGKELDPKKLAKDGPRAKEMLSKELKEIEHIVKVEVTETLVYTKDLVQLVLRLEDAIFEVINQEVKAKLQGQMKLPEVIGKTITDKLDKIIKETQTTSELNKVKAAELTQMVEQEVEQKMAA